MQRTVEAENKDVFYDKSTLEYDTSFYKHNNGFCISNTLLATDNEFTFLDNNWWVSKYRNILIPISLWYIYGSFLKKISYIKR